MNTLKLERQLNAMISHGKAVDAFKKFWAPRVGTRIQKEHEATTDS